MDTVFDPFTGTVSTQVTARRRGRIVEVNADYHAAAMERLAS